MKHLAVIPAALALLIASSGPAIPSEPRPVDRARSEVVAREDLVEYVTVAGDTLQGIAASHFVRPGDWRQAQSFNRIADGTRLKPGTRLAFRSDWLKSEPIVATLAAYRGNVRVSDAAGVRPLSKGMELAEGDLIETAANSYATMLLPDGSQVSLPSSSRIRISRMRAVGLTQSIDRRFTLERGRSDMKVTPMKNAASKFLITTPVAVAAVRGTSYRVSFTPQDGVQKTEVTEGKVGVYRLRVAGQPEALVPAGFGALAADKTAATPVALLDAPQLDDPDTTQTDSKVRFRFRPKPGISGYLVEIATDEQFIDRVVSVEVKTPVATIDDVENGKLFLRYAAIADNGLTGKPAVLAFDRKLDPDLARRQKEQTAREALAALGRDEDSNAIWYGAGSELDEELYAAAAGGSGDNSSDIPLIDDMADWAMPLIGGGASSGEETGGWIAPAPYVPVTANNGTGGGGGGGGGGGRPGNDNGGEDDGGVIVIPTDPEPPVGPPGGEPGNPGTGGGNNGGGEVVIPTPGTIPEPGTWLMLVAGFGLIGTMIRRRHGFVARQ